MAEIQYIPDPRAPFSEGGSRGFDCCCELPPPTNLESLAGGALIIDVSWTDNATDETGYEVRWRNLTTGGSFVDSPDRPANSTTATVNTTGGAQDGDLIEVQVRAVNADCSSVWVSDEVIVTDVN